MRFHAVLFPVIIRTIGLLSASPALAQENQKPGFPPSRERAVLAPRPSLPATDRPRGSETWSIVLAGVVAPDEPPGTRESVGLEALRKIQVDGKLPEAYMEPRGKALVLAYGHYPGPTDEAAQKDLARIRAIKVDDAQPFADAYLAPPDGDALKGSVPEFDLRNAVAQFGAKRAKYTLQVGVYGDADPRAPLPSARELQEIRAAAELAAATLRREGELAFYYHGPVRSTVTIGLFSEKDIDARQPGGEAQALRELRSRQPYNLLNGKGIKEFIKGRTTKDGKPVEKLQESRLVAVPQ